MYLTVTHVEATSAELKSYSAEYKTQGKMTLDGRKRGSVGKVLT